MGFLYRLAVLIILAVFVGSIVGALHSGRLVVSVPLDSTTWIVGIAEVIIASTMLVTGAVEGSSFLLNGGRNTIRASMPC